MLIIGSDWAWLLRTATLLLDQKQLHLPDVRSCGERHPCLEPFSARKNRRRQR